MAHALQGTPSGPYCRDLDPPPAEDATAAEGMMSNPFSGGSIPIDSFTHELSGLGTNVTGDFE